MSFSNFLSELELGSSSRIVDTRFYLSKMSTAELNPRPLRVSPFIKFCRWTMLLSGIMYGAYYHRKYKNKEDARRAEELRLKPIRDAQLAEERRLTLLAEQKLFDEWISSKPK